MIFMENLATSIGGILLGTPDSWALFDQTKRHRYALGRDWWTPGTGDKMICMFLLMNPSTADHVKLDRTLNGCMDRAGRWGYHGMLVANVCSWRCPVPEALARPEAWHLHGNNQVAIRALAEASDIIVCGWGSCRHVKPHRLPDLSGFESKLRALRVNRDGNPGHPLYLRRDLNPLPFVG